MAGDLGLPNDTVALWTQDLGQSPDAACKALATMGNGDPNNVTIPTNPSQAYRTNIHKLVNYANQELDPEAADAYGKAFAAATGDNDERDGARRSRHVRAGAVLRHEPRRGRRAADCRRRHGQDRRLVHPGDGRRRLQGHLFPQWDAARSEPRVHAEARRVAGVHAHLRRGRGGDTDVRQRGRRGLPTRDGVGRRIGRQTEGRRCEQHGVRRSRLRRRRGPGEFRHPRGARRARRVGGAAERAHPQHSLRWSRPDPGPKKLPRTCRTPFGTSPST